MQVAQANEGGELRTKPEEFPRQVGQMLQMIAATKEYPYDAVRGGAYGEYPSLERDELAEGDLRWNNDFRGTYATLLERWMGLDSQPILGESFEQFDFIK